MRSVIVFVTASCVLLMQTLHEYDNNHFSTTKGRGLTSLQALQLQERGLEREKRWRGTMKRWVYNFVPTLFPKTRFLISHFSRAIISEMTTKRVLKG